MANLPKGYILPLGSRIVEKMTEEEEMQVVLDGLAEDMPDEDELEPDRPARGWWRR